MIIKTVQTLVFEYPEDYQAEIEWNKKRDGDWVHQSTDTMCSVYTLTNNYLIPTKAKHSFLDNPYFEAEPRTEEPSFTATDFGKGTITRYTDEPQTDCPQSAICCKPCKECGACEKECGMWEILKNEPQTAECPFDDKIPCEWVCTEYGKCKYKPKTEPQTDCSWK